MASQIADNNSKEDNDLEFWFNAMSPVALSSFSSNTNSNKNTSANVAAIPPILVARPDRSRSLAAILTETILYASILNFPVTATVGNLFSVNEFCFLKYKLFVIFSFFFLITNGETKKVTN